jgi:hypothetical protein
MNGILGNVADWPRIRAEREARERQETEKANRQAAILADLEETLDVILAEDIVAVTKERRASYPQPLRAAFARFRTYAAETGVPALPADPAIVASYLLEQRPRSMKAVNEIVEAVSVTHGLVQHPFEDPTLDPYVPAAIRFLQHSRKRAKKVQDGRQH